MYLTALIIDCAIARLYRHNGAMNKSVKLDYVIIYLFIYPYCGIALAIVFYFILL